MALLVEFGLDGIKQLAINDWLLLASQDLVLVFDLANIEAVAEKMSRPRSFVTRMLSGSHNLTVKTFARALAACGYELKLSYGPIQWGWAPHQMNLCAEDIDSAAPASCGQFEAYAPSVGFEVSALLA